MASNYSFKIIKKAVERAIEKLLINDSELLDNNTNERSISHKLAEYLQQEFSSWHVDCEYNRAIDDPKKMVVRYRGVTDDDLEAKTVYPDIIVHHRRTDENLLVIEMKKWGGDQQKDRKKLEVFTGPQFRYEFGLLLMLGFEKPPILAWFKDGREVSEE